MADYNFSKPEDDYSDQIERSEYSFTGADDDYNVPNPDMERYSVNEYGPLQTATIGAGYGMDRTVKGLRDLALASKELFGSEKTAAQASMDRARLQEEIKTAKDDFYRGIANEDSPVRGWAKGGDIVGEILPSLLLPGAKAKSMIGRGAQLAGVQGLYEALTTPGSIGDRLVSGATGAVGAGTGSIALESLGKVGSALAGKYKDPMVKAVRDRLVAMGLRPNIGDISPKGEGSFIRGVENFHASTPWGSGALAKEANKLDDLIVPSSVRKNVVKEGAEEVTKNLQIKSDMIWKPFNDFVSQNKVPGVRPVNLKQGLDELLKHDKNFLNKLPDDQVREKLYGVLDTPISKLKSIPIEEYNVLMQKLGAMTPAVRAAAQPVPGSTKIADTGVYAKFSSLLKGISDDFEQWGTYKTAKPAYELFKQSKSSWEKEVLPWKTSDIAHQLKEVPLLKSADTADLISKERNTKVVDELRKYMRDYGTKEGSNVTDALASMRRAAGKIGAIDESPHASSLTTTVLEPIIGSLATPLGVASRKRAFQNLWFAPSEHMVPSLVPGGLNALRNIPIGAAREFGPEIGTIEAMIYDLMKKEDQDEEVNMGNQHFSGIGSATQAGVR